MKTIIFLLSIVCLPFFVWGQKNNTVRDTLENVDVTPPEFTGIKNAALMLNNTNSVAFEEYMMDNFVYPDEVLNCLNQGTIVVQFVVNENGELTDFDVINSICPEIDEEFIRVLENTTGMWKPGFNNGKPVPMEKEASMMIVASMSDKDLKAPREYFKRLATSYWKKGNKLFLEKNNFKRAVKQYDQAIKYLPYDGSAFLARGLCKYELGDKEGARADWERINRIGAFDTSSFIEELTYQKGFDEMIAIIGK